MSDMDDQMLSIAEIVDIMGLSPGPNGGLRTVRTWLKSGDLKGINLSGRAGWRVRRGDLNEFIRHRAVRSAIGEAINA